MAEFAGSAKGRSAALADLPPISSEVNGAFTLRCHAANGGFVARSRRSDGVHCVMDRGCAAESRS